MSLFFTGNSEPNETSTTSTNNNNHENLNLQTDQSISNNNNNNNNINNNSANNRNNSIWNDPNDDFESDQLDEDESYSWASTDNQDALGINNTNSNNHNTVAGCSSTIANWRDWRSNNFTDLFINNLNIINRSNNNNNINFLTKSNQLKNLSKIINNKNGNKIEKLVDLCAKYVASNLPFECVETYKEPVPEDLQLKITFESFPDNIENIRLYSCLANGNADEYLRGEQLYRNRAVRKIIQIGFHLSAQVTHSSNNNIPSNNSNHNINNFKTNNLIGNLTCLTSSSSSSSFSSVAIVCDRKRIISCSCTCTKQTISWCSHIVAVCLNRILEPLGVEYRAPVSESLSKLKRDQLQKFAQYLISELPQQILPTAQKLLDELLKSDESSINLLSGAPDPTAGASQNDISIWCLDECVLQENIHKTLIKFIAPTPNVVSDIECLEHASSATAAEYTSLLRPLRGREPEAMWNLVQIVKEMLKQRDKNSMPLLRIITNECLNIDQIVQLWFLVKASQLNHDKALFNSVSANLNNNQNHNRNGSSNSTLTTPVYQACSNLMEEIVSLWRNACLNPLLNDFEEKQLYREQLIQWNKNIFDKLKKFCNNILNNSYINSNNIWSTVNTNNTQTNNLEKLLKRLDTDLFYGLLPAISACDLNWDDFEFQSISSFKNNCIKSIFEIDTNSQINLLNEENDSIKNDRVDSATEQEIKQNLANNLVTEDLSNLYHFDFDPYKFKLLNNSNSDSNSNTNNKEKQFFNIDLKVFNLNSNKEDLLFSRCEALFCHGFLEHSCYLAQSLANYMLKNNNFDNFYLKSETHHQTTSNIQKPITLRHKCINNFQNTILWKCSLLCNIFYETSLIFPNCDILFNNNNNNMNDMKNLIAINEDILKYKTSKLCETSKLNQLAFQIGILGLEKSRIPAISKALEVKLLNQEQELVNLLKKLHIGSYELALLRHKAFYLKEKYSEYQKPNQTLPIMLGWLIFDILYNYGFHSNDTNLDDQDLAFNSSLSVLGMKINISESQHPLLCEGIRRQKGDLALNLLLTYKDDEQKLLKIMDKILDKDFYILFKNKITIFNSNPFNPNFKKIQQQQLQEFVQLGLSEDPLEEKSTSQNCITDLNQISSFSNLKSTIPNSNIKHQNKKISSAIDSLSSGWEESENESSNLSGDVSLLETKYRCLSLKQQQQNSTTTTTTQNETLINNSIDNNNQVSQSTGLTETTSSDNSPTVANRKLCSNFLNAPILNKSSKSIDDSGDDSAESSSSLENREASETLKNNNNSISSQLSQAGSNSLATNNSLPNQIDNQNLDTTNLICNNNKFVNRLTTNNNNNTNFENSKFNYNCLINQMNNFNNNRQLNQPSEALAHFMFEFSKTVLSKAGGSVSTSVFLNNQNHQSGTGPHRNLHICSFLISLYALGLHNCVQPSWLSRTYSSHVTWVNSQAVDIGYVAICILIECWQGLLTPSECVSLADRASRGRDNMAVKAAAELALSSLRFAHLMNLTEIQRALVQCKEQSKEMLQRACIIVENAVKDANCTNLLEILFSIAKRWDELFIEACRDSPNSLSSQNFNQADHSKSTNSNDSHISKNNNFQANIFLNYNNNEHLLNRGPINTGLNFQNCHLKNVQQSNLFGNASNLASNSVQNNITLSLLQSNLNHNSQYMPIYMQSSILSSQQQTQAINVPQNSFSMQPIQYNPANINNNNINPHFDYNNQIFPNQCMNQNSLNIQSTNSSFKTIDSTNTNMYSIQNQFQNYQQQQQQQQQQQNYLQNLMRHQQNQMQFNQNTTQPQTTETIDTIYIKHLTSAFRVGMMGLEALPRRADGSHQLKYRQSPAYADDVKWLWEVAVKLDTYLKTSNNLQQFCQTASIVLQNPFLIQELIFDSANFLTRNNPSQFSMVFCSPILNSLVQRCLNLYFRCCMSKLHHLTPNEHEDFIHMLLTARNIFYFSGNMNYFSDLIQNLRRSNKCKKDIWNKICNALNNQ